MPAQFTKHFVQDLTQDIKIRQCGTIVFNADNLSNVITVDLYNGTEPYSGGGTVAGAVICPDGATVALDNGTLTGNVASVTLKADCFAIPGQIGVGVQVISGSIRTTVLKAIYNVELLSTDNMVDPDSRITASVTQLVADIEAATADIPASDMASLMSGIAPTFSTSTSYAAWAYVYYSGTLYRFTADHAAGSWTGDPPTDATAVVLGNDLGIQVSTLKNAFVNDTAQITGSMPIVFKSGLYRTSGSPSKGDTVYYENDERYVCAICECTKDSVISAHVYGGSSYRRAYYFCDADMKALKIGTASTEYNGIIIPPDDDTVRYLALNNMPTQLPSGYYAYKGVSINERLNEITTNPSSAIMSSGASATVDGITVTRLSNTSFKLSGSSSSNYSKLYNFINGISASGRSTGNVYTPNILTPGNYKLKFETNYYTENTLFLIVPQGGSWADRQYLENGSSFTITENSSVALIIYGGTKYNYTNELIVNFWLEFENYEVKSNSAVDVYGRMLINDLQNKESMIRSDDRNALLSAAIGNLSYAVDGNGHELFKNGGAANAYKKAMQCVNVTWTNIETIPDRKTRPDIEPGTYTGIIYSSVKEKEKYVFLDVSLTTFMTALHNPYSLLYTEDVDGDVNQSAYGFTYHGVNCGAYYGTVCSVLVGYSVGWGVRWETADFDYLRRKGILVQIPDVSADSVQRFDIMWESGHTRLVTDITRDEYGIPSSIVVSESMNLAHSTTYSKNGFNTYLTNHKCLLYRYVDLYKNTSYTPSPFVAVLNETPETYVYNDDICTFAGDYAAFSKGQIIHINYTKGNYTSMVIASDETVVQTITLPVSYNTTHSIDITNLNLDAGLYTAYLTDGTNNSEPTHFEIIDTTTTISGTLNDLTVTFNAESNPYYLEVASLSGVSHGKYVLTAKDIDSGEVTVDFAKIANEMYGENYATDNYLRCIYQGQYGRVINDPIQIN